MLNKEFQYYFIKLVKLYYVKGSCRKGNKKEEWKKINTTNVGPYKFDIRFFYWLLSKNGTSFKIKTNINQESTYEIKLKDISAVAQLADKEEYDSTSRGTNILGSLPALSGLGSNQSVYEAGFYFEVPAIEFYLRLEDNSTCFIDTSNSIIKKEDGSFASIKTEYIRCILTVNVILLITLKENNIGMEEIKKLFPIATVK
ncbi:TPA: hypothetical protein QC471_004566 [Bacillus toyonensis]|nr:hypothetical protein [Bacillus toyonensis]